MTMMTRRTAVSSLMAATAMGAMTVPIRPAHAASIGTLTVMGPIPVNAQSGESYRGSNEQPVAGPGAPMPDLEKYGYMQEEYFISGTVDGKPFTTSMLVRKPKDLSKFSGLVGVETIHAAGAIPFWGVGREVWAPGGHVWIAVASQRAALENQVKRFNAARYATLNVPQVGAPPGRGGAGGPALAPSGEMTQDQFSQAIMTQVGAFLKSNPRTGPLVGRPVKYLLMGGSSQTGGTTNNYIRQSHATARLPNGKPIYDGYLPGYSFPSEPLRAEGAAIIHFVSEGEVVNAANNKRPTGDRPDSDAPNDRFRAYQLVGGSHVPTRGQPAKTNPPEMPSQFPSAPINKMALINLIDWVTKGKAPPKAPKIEVANGQVVRDEYGNAKGGIRSPYVDVPAVRYIVTRPPIPGDQAGAQARSQQGIQEPLPAETLKRLYPTRQAYLTRFNQGIDKMVAGGWMLKVDGEKLKAEEAAKPPV